MNKQDRKQLEDLVDTLDTIYSDLEDSVSHDSFDL